ncbi:MAG: NUMOD3 domain-containing DNA-binding protein [Proteobacteria bacterium]|jgi:group I intron endonuclease|nr:NUMOD3 domain-containing DNA-binding protein [Pseudomonadota bacterium]
MNYIIYRITNKINDKKYIGFSSKSLEERWNKHLRDAKAGRDTYLCRAIRKYGGDNFDREVIYTGDDISYTKYVMENKFIIENEAHCTTGKGYNMTMGGDGTLDHTHSESTRRQMSISHTGMRLSESAKQKLSEQRKGVGNPNFGKPPSLETRKKISQANMGRNHSEEAKNKMSEQKKGDNNPNFDKPPSQETREKISASLKRRYAMNGNPNFGKSPSKETREKISVSLKKRYAMNKTTDTTTLH